MNTSASSPPRWSVRLFCVVLVLGIVAATRGSAGAQCVVDADCAFGFPYCEVNPRCVGGQCVTDPRNCSDGDPCTTDTCNPILGRCEHAPLCPNDGLACNGDEVCVVISYFLYLAFCPLTFPPNCNDSNACTIDSCVDPSGCQHVALDCDDGDACTADTCDPYAVQGSSPCAHTAIAGCCHASADCPDDACAPGLCTAGTCGTGTPISCDDGDPATQDSCDPVAGCKHLPLSEIPCQTAADCPLQADPCVAVACEQQKCAAHPLGGIDGAACICERSDPATCAGADMPAKAGAARARACDLIARAAAGGKKAPKLLTKAKKQLGRARRSIARSKALDDACRGALDALISDDVTRLDAAKKQLGRAGS